MGLNTGAVQENLHNVQEILYTAGVGKVTGVHDVNQCHTHNNIYFVLVPTPSLLDTISIFGS